MANVWTADNTSDVCFVCGKPDDDHILRELREHRATADMSRPYEKYDEPQMVLLDGKTIEVSGVSVASALTEDEEGRLQPTIIFRFQDRATKQDFPDIHYRNKVWELMNLGSTIVDAADNCITEAIKYGRANPRSR